MGVVRRSAPTPHDEDESAEDYIPEMSGKDYPEYVAGRNNTVEGMMTQEQFSEGKLLSLWMLIIVGAAIDKYLQSRPPRKEPAFNAEDRKRMDEVALKLYQAVVEGRTLVHYSAPSLFEVCSCARE
jgi:hypothetical protein